MKTTVVIPARLGSQRFFGKLLMDLLGKPVLQHTWERVKQVKRVTEVLVATDSPKIADAVKSWGGDFVMTDPECTNGTARVASVVRELRGDFILNVQGDECCIDPLLLDQLISNWNAKKMDVLTPVFKIEQYADLIDPNLVKAVLTGHGRALYFSRSPLPHIRGVALHEWLNHAEFFGHVGVYGYSPDFLKNYGKLPVSHLEELEKLEQLRFLEGNCNIQTITTQYRKVAVDTPEDLVKAKQFLSATVC